MVAKRRYRSDRYRLIPVSAVYTRGERLHKIRDRPETSFSSSNSGFGIESSVSESQPDGSELVTYSSVEVNFMDFLAEAASFMLSTFDYMPIYETLWVY